MMAVTPEGPCGRELTQLVSHHILRDEDGNVLPSVMYRDRVPDHQRIDGRAPGPALNDALVASSVHIFDSLEEFGVGIWTLLQRTRH